MRPDNWWVQPVVVAVGLLVAIIYLNWAAFQGEYNGER